MAQNILEAEGPWFESFLIVRFGNILALNINERKFVYPVPDTFWMVQNILLVYVCEMIIDIIKHSFIAKFNNIKPIAYSEFLEDLCKQVLSSDFMFVGFIYTVLFTTKKV